MESLKIDTYIFNVQIYAQTHHTSTRRQITQKQTTKSYEHESTDFSFPFLTKIERSILNLILVCRFKHAKSAEWMTQSHIEFIHTYV